MVTIQPIYGDDWGMVYYVFTHIKWLISPHISLCLYNCIYYYHYISLTVVNLVGGLEHLDSFSIY